MKIDILINELGIGKYFYQKECNALLVGEQADVGEGDMVGVNSPIDNQFMVQFKLASINQVNETLTQFQTAHQQLRSIPAPIRGKLVKIIGRKVQAKKNALAHMITFEVGKPLSESRGEVQEWIDICDFAVGLSRQLTGLTLATERYDHRLMEQWHPLGPVLVISAFNFPVAVWAWNAMLAFVCGDSVVWKPSLTTPLCSIAVHKIVMDSIAEISNEGEFFPTQMHGVFLTGVKEAQELVTQPIFPLVSATGSVQMGRDVAVKVAHRLGRSLLELGGNNALIISENADMDLAISAAVFSAVGTSGQRCTTLRRLIIHEAVEKEVMTRMIKAYNTLKIGNPLDEKNHLGPLINQMSYLKMMEALHNAKEQGGEIIWGGERIYPEEGLGGYYVTPALIKINKDAAIVKQETFAPILYIITYRDLSEAIEINNNVPQGLSSALFSTNILEVEKFISVAGSDCGLVNINVGTSGAEIGGAFGGEKETGGGRESGSDAWKNYMRRVTSTINYSKNLPLAQGIKFDL